MLSVTLINHTPMPEKTVAAAAKLCYSDTGAGTLLDGLDDEKTTKFIGMLMEMGHESPLEHVSFTFAIEGVSRALLAQITRHRIASYSVQSQRYVHKKEFDFVIPPEIEKIDEAKQLFVEAINRDISYYEKLTDILTKAHIKTLIEQGEDEKTAQKKAEKQAIEDARYVLPNAADTKIVVTMNARSLLNFFKERCCSRAQWEIRALADEMLKTVKGVAPVLFAKAGPPCVRGACPEGKMSCMKANERRKYYLGE